VSGRRHGRKHLTISGAARSPGRDEPARGLRARMRQSRRPEVPHARRLLEELLPLPDLPAAGVAVGVRRSSTSSSATTSTAEPRPSGWS
jgi:hypothetical protein